MILLIAWALGFVSINWSSDSRAAVKMERVQARLAEAEDQLEGIEDQLDEVRTQVEMLGGKRSDLLESIEALDKTRSQIETTLAEASSVVSGARDAGSLGSWIDGILRDTASNIVWLGITIGGAFFVGRRTKRIGREPESASESTAR